MATLLGELRGTVRHIVITELKEAEKTFYATIVLEAAGVTHEVDARPSDALALAVRAKTPIFVEEALLEWAAQQDTAKFGPCRPYGRFLRSLPHSPCNDGRGQEALCSLRLFPEAERFPEQAARDNGVAVSGPLRAGRGGKGQAPLREVVALMRRVNIRVAARQGCVGVVKEGFLGQPYADPRHARAKVSPKPWN